MRVDDEPLDLTEDLIEIAPPDEGGEDDVGIADADETVISFSDEDDDEADATPLVKLLREQIRDRDRKLSQMRRAPAPANDADPEPTIPEEPDIEKFGWDVDRHAQAAAEWRAAIKAHAQWETREEKRKGERSNQETEQARQIEQQRKALGVGDYEVKAGIVRERLTDAQMAILISGADNPAQMIYALGRSESRLDMLCGEDNLAKFAVMLGKMEKDIKVTKKSAPAPESRVRGASAPMAIGGDKQLDKLEKEAAKTGDRSKLIAYRQNLKNRAA